MRETGAGPRLLRVLCLHGYTQSADTLRVRTGALRKGLKQLCEFTFVDAPHLATADFVAEGGPEGGAARQLAWWNAASDEADGTRPSQSRTYVGFDESQRFLEGVIEAQGPFDGVLAFSQGAAVGAVMLAALSAKGHSALPTFALLISGFIPRDERVGAVLRAGPPVAVATMHVCGELDALVAPEQTEALSTHFEGARVFKHSGGHAIPGNAEFRNAARAFIQPHYETANAKAQ